MLNLQSHLIKISSLLILSNVCTTVKSFSVNRPHHFVASPTLHRNHHHVNTITTKRSGETTTHLQMLEMPNSFITAVETFDGSTIADPIVVSSVFWSSLSSKIISVILGQVLASIVFAALSYLVSTQFTKIGDYVSTNIFNEDVVKKNVDQIKDSVKTRSQTPTVPPNFGKLLVCLAIDIIGTSSELLPIIGELTDVVWAPIAALSLRSLFQGSNVVFALEFAEEIFPFTDILPLATICWIVETFYGDSSFAQTLQIGVYGKENLGNGSQNSGVIDVVSIDDQRDSLSQKDRTKM